jgi:hypothetical protein
MKEGRRERESGRDEMIREDDRRTYDIESGGRVGERVSDSWVVSNSEFSVSIDENLEVEEVVGWVTKRERSGSNLVQVLPVVHNETQPVLVEVNLHHV